MLEIRELTDDEIGKGKFVPPESEIPLMYRMPGAPMLETAEGILKGLPIADLTMIPKQDLVAAQGHAWRMIVDAANCRIPADHKKYLIAWMLDEWFEWAWFGEMPAELRSRLDTDDTDDTDDDVDECSCPDCEEEETAGCSAGPFCHFCTLSGCDFDTARCLEDEEPEDDA